MSQAPKTSQTLTPFRLRKHADYQRAYEGAKKKQSASMSWFLALREEANALPRVGLTVGKVIGMAHERNRIKRRLRDLLRRHTAKLPTSCDLILHPRRSVLTIEPRKLEAELLRILTDAQKDAERLIEMRRQDFVQGSVQGSLTGSAK
jgi:ribonuclease P protein component